MIRLTAIAIAFILLVSGAAGADSAGGIDFTGHDIATLMLAVQNVDTSDNILLNVSSKAPADMPSYDPIVHYAGLVPNGKPGEGTLWMVKGIDMKNPASGPAFRAAMELASMDTGDAGPKWKTIYDAVAAADSRLDPSVSDRYRNRHLLTSLIKSAIDNVEKASASPSPAP